MNNEQLTPSPPMHIPAWLSGLRITRWILVVLGAIAVFMGLFILFGGDEEYVGLGGEASWRVGDIHPLWGWGLVIGGAVMLLVGALVVLRNREAVRAGTAQPVSPGADLITHASVFVLVNALVWAQDIAIGDGLNYAWWVTAPWAIGLAAHAMAYRSGTRH